MIRAMGAGPVLEGPQTRNGHARNSRRAASDPIVMPRNQWYLRWKSLSDALVAFALIIVVSPVVMACALLVKLTSRGPAFYSQTRLGRNGRPFRLYKLRTMRHDAEARTGPVWSTRNDPRVTPVGRFLRETHLDEFPQLVNVLLGHMSLVGPRPERPEIATHLQEQLPLYQQRLHVRPGISGLAQLKLPPDSDLESVRLKLVHDLYYVQHVSPWLDLRILSCTLGEFLYSLGSFVWKPLALPNTESVEAEVESLACTEMCVATVPGPALKG